MEFVLRRLSEGATEEDLLASYPGLELAEIRAALSFAASEIALAEYLVPA